MAAIAAVNVALWDIKGKVLNTPVYNLLGGASRRGCMVYTHANVLIRRPSTPCRSIWMRATCGPRTGRRAGAASTYGAPKGGKPYAPAERGLPLETIWSSEKYLRLRLA